MALEILDQALTATRVACFVVCSCALLVYTTFKDHLEHTTMSGLSLLMLIIQLAVLSAELFGPLCLGAKGPLLNSLGSSLMVVLVDFLAASFLAGTGIGCVGITILKIHDHVCFSKCWASFYCSLLVILGGAIAFIATLLNQAVACKRNLERHQLRAKPSSQF